MGRESRADLGRGRPGVGREAQELHGLAAPHRAAPTPSPAAAAAAARRCPVGVRSVEKARESRTNRAARASPSLESRRASLPPDALVASQQPSDLA